MRHRIPTLLALTLTTGLVACDGEDAGVDAYDANESAAPSADAPVTRTPDLDAPVMTPRFEAVGDAGTDHVTGLARIYAETGGATATADELPEVAGVEAAEEDPAAGRARAGTGGFRVEVVLDGLSPGPHAWHIHAGPCGEPAPVAVAITPTADGPGLGRPLEVEPAGATVRASALIPADQLTLEELRSGRYSLHVHRSGGADHGPTVACADLSADEDAVM